MKYFFGFLLSIALVIMVFFLVIRGLSGGGSDTAQERKALVSYANTDTEVRLTVDGPIVADQQHNSARITVNRNLTTIDVFSGYQDNRVNGNSFANNEESYAQFLRALDLAGFSLGVTDVDAAQKDSRGTCARGSRYTLEIVNETRTIQNFWATNCGKEGTFKGQLGPVSQLFQRQIPDLSTYLSNVNVRF